MADREAGRLVREGVLIVASILLAFAIDAGWDAWQDRADEREVLRALLGDFETNRAQAAEAIAVHEAGHRVMAAAVGRSRAEVRALPEDSVGAVFVAMANPRTFDPVRGTLDALLASGRFELLRDDELRRSLTTFDNIFDDSAEDMAYLASSSEKVWDRMIVHGGPWRAISPLVSKGCEEGAVTPTCGIEFSEWAHFPAPTPRALQEMLDDRTSMGFVRQYLVNSSHYTGEMRRQLRQIDAILALLHANLGTTYAPGSGEAPNG